MRAWPRLQWFQRLPPDPRAEATSACFGACATQQRLGTFTPITSCVTIRVLPGADLFAKRLWTGHVIELNFGRSGVCSDGTSGFHRPSLAPYNTRNLPPKAGPSPCGPFQGGPPTGGMPAYHDRMSPRWHLRALVQGLLLPDPDKRLVSLRNLFRW
jgi:hypothetical protein